VLDACLKCGYTRGEPKAPAPAPVSKPASSAAVLEAAREVPTWVWVLAGGCLTILAVCAAMSLRLSANGFDRALVSTVLLAAGLVGMIVAELWVIPLIMMDAPELRTWDFLVPYRLWAVAAGKLPRTRRPVCLVSWCLTGMLGALVIIGGLWYWLPGKKNVKFRLEAPVAKVGPGPVEAPTDEVINKQEEVIAGKPAPADEEETEAEAKGQKTTLRCVVIGYIPHDDGMSLVLGVEEKKGQYRYAGVVRRGLNAITAEKVRNRLSPHTRVEPLIPDLPVKAVWVEPCVSCEVTQAGTGVASVLPNPVFKDLVPDPSEEKK
jgi:hypothetical protein